MTSLRTSVHQTIGIAVSDEEDGKSTTKGYEESSILELAKGTIHKVRVLHRKRERSNVSTVIPDTNNPETHCEFEWELAMTFDSNMELLTEATLCIIDVAMPENISPERRSEILSAISPFTSRDFPYIVVWKSINRHNIQKELSSLCSICEIIDGDGAQLFEAASKSSVLSSLLLCITAQFTEDGSIAHEILSTTEQKGSQAKVIKQFLNLLKEDNRVHQQILNTLKATNSELLNPTLTQFRNLLKEHVKEIIPVKGTHRIVIVFSNSDIQISQYQRYRGKLSENSENALFVFGCVQHMYFSKSLNHLDSVTVEITEHSFFQKEQIKQILEPFLTHNTVESKTNTISIADALRCLENALSQLPESALVVKDPEIGRNMSALNLLDLLRQTIPEGFPALTFTELKNAQIP